MKKRILTMLLALMMLLPLAACGDGKDSADAETGALTGSDAVNTDVETDDDSGVDIVDDNSTEVYRILSRDLIYYDDPDWKVDETWKYGYNDKGQLTYIRRDTETDPIFTVTYDGDGNVTEMFDMEAGAKWIFKNGDIASVEKYLRGGTKPISCVLYSYDENGNVLIITECEGDEVIKTTEYGYDYDGEGNVTAQYYLEEVERQIFRGYEYDGKGQLTSLYIYNPGDAEPYRETRYEYDGNGNVTALNNICSADYGEGPFWFVLSKTEYIRDGEGNVIAENEYEGGEDGELTLVATAPYTYDGEGRLVSVDHIFDESDPKIRETYEYDDEGNKTSDKMMYERGYDGEWTGEGSSYTYREFSLTEEEIALVEASDAIIMQYTDFLD